MIRSSHPVRKRPRFALWMWQRGLTTRDAEAPLGRSRMTVSRYLYDLDDPARVIPDASTMARIQEWTGGEIGPGDFYESGGNGAATEQAAASPVTAPVAAPLEGRP